MILHPCLPCKNGDLGNPDQLQDLNDYIVDFVFSEEKSQDMGLKTRVRRCTQETLHPGAVVRASSV